MPTYRLYLLDGAGRVASAEWIEATDDAAGIATARQRGNNRRCELWQGQRVVARMSADGSDCGDSQ